MNPLSFCIHLDVRAGDLNYGNHVSHHNYFLYFQEARIAYLGQLGYTEMDIEGLGMVIAEAGCRYKHELLLGDKLGVCCGISEIKAKAFTFEYAIVRGETLCATGSTACLCLDRTLRKVVPLPPAFTAAVQAFEAKRRGVSSDQG
ncbi:MAG: thioesterase family protein [Desulfosarcinaceae bacterium]